ncbi:metallophosphoesterase family protein [Clostridium sp. D2Q-11]|uniref:Phosphoesterase n=1 Tax=Anaeromonas frigoriresistens TaxID=2683708 RepID=A0A942UZE3_9FIRM|nr:metallophosphoesterase family protein [Anaeromonas frigoriresistens]MBS4537272.1 metallophosphoesterase family protein [Anaeromonas frigoriresistens]
MSIRIGVISDTHGLFREEMHNILKDVDKIIHLGDIGKLDILELIQKIAPTVSILGNIDENIYSLPATESLEIKGVKIYMIHNIKEINKESISYDTRIILYGHSHKPNLNEKDNIIYFNPGSIGPRRFSLPITYGIMDINNQSIHIRIYDLFSKEILIDKTYDKNKDT